MRFDFKLLENSEIEGLLKHIFDDSNIKYDEESVALIARLGEGSVRDALSVAEMCCEVVVEADDIVAVLEQTLA